MGVYQAAALSQGNELPQQAFQELALTLPGAANHVDVGVQILDGNAEPGKPQVEVAQEWAART